MKKFLTLILVLGATGALAQTPNIDEISRSELEKIGKEFAVNFSHTAVAAPETNGIWGIEVGLIAGQTGSPGLKNVVDRNNGDGDKFNNIYHAGLMARAHFPFELFVEASMLPEQELSSLKVSSQGFGLGWNAGSFFNLPLDLALGMNHSSSDTSFSQIIGANINADINIKGSAQTYWLGVSKTFAFITPYAKVGMASTKADVNVDAASGTIFNYTNSQKESVSASGSYAAVGANLQLILFRFGLEASQTVGVKRVSGKLSLAF
jgi:hypothetical protein